MILLQNMIPTYILFRLFIFRFCVFEDFEHLLSKQKMCQFLWHGGKRRVFSPEFCGILRA